MLGAVGGPKWDTTDPAKPRPEQGLLGIRKALGLFANLRPVKIFDALRDASSLKPEFLEGVEGEGPEGMAPNFDDNSTIAPVLGTRIRSTSPACGA